MATSPASQAATLHNSNSDIDEAVHALELMFVRGEATLADFTAKFKDQLAPEVILAMRAFFHLDDKAVNSVEEALIDHGGEAAMERTQDDVQAQLNLGSQ
ncbi:hypothetical protein D1007_52223 [Hordeum vulgare]|nr:hypothetical protein D1007_52223 [Hordeum vulgare]